MALVGVPNETRKAFPDGTTMFERVLPGPDRMYPDTDSAPIPIDDEDIDSIRKRLPVPVEQRLKQLQTWKVPEDTYPYLLKRNLVWIIDKVSKDFGYSARYVGTLFGHTIKSLEGRGARAPEFNDYAVYELINFVHSRGLDPNIAREMIPVIMAHPDSDFETVLTGIQYRKHSLNELLAQIPALQEEFSSIAKTNNRRTAADWTMGKLRRHAMGNVPLGTLREHVESEICRA